MDTMTTRERRLLFVYIFVLMVLVGGVFWAIGNMSQRFSPATPVAQTAAGTPPSEETALRAKMCNTIREAVREYATHVLAPDVSIGDRDSAVFAVYMLCMMQAPR